ncbi:MAG: enoyl-CoA hydratase/isomerase family protein [Chloroflexi bacterium]|nr:enoyl-CoA hydratase/isomerase family protein [Chloroflexota bacterium]
MPVDALSLTRRGPIAYLALERGDEGNAIDAATLRDLAGACEAIEGDEDVRVVVLSGGEGPLFSGGWDSTLLAGEGVPTDAFACLAELPRPVVCALNGDAFSAGLEMALACDVRVAAQGARFGFPEVGLGLIPMGGGSQRLARAVGRTWAAQLIMAGEPIDAGEALRIGLVSRVVPRGKLLAEAEAVAGRIAERGPLAVRYAKEAVSRGVEMTLEQALRYETDLTVILQTTEDRAEGVRAFLEKRKPKFRGK